MWEVAGIDEASSSGEEESIKYSRHGENLNGPRALRLFLTLLVLMIRKSTNFFGIIRNGKCHVQWQSIIIPVWICLALGPPRQADGPAQPCQIPVPMALVVPGLCLTMVDLARPCPDSGPQPDIMACPTRSFCGGEVMQCCGAYPEHVLIVPFSAVSTSWGCLLFSSVSSGKETYLKTKYGCLASISVIPSWKLFQISWVLRPWESSHCVIYIVYLQTMTWNLGAFGWCLGAWLKE